MNFCNLTLLSKMPTKPTKETTTLLIALVIVALVYAGIKLYKIWQ